MMARVFCGRAYTTQEILLPENLCESRCGICGYPPDPNEHHRQKILTADKVPLHINFARSYRVTDYVKILTGINVFAEQMHVAAQSVLRKYVGKHKPNEILENKRSWSVWSAFARILATFL